MRMTNSFRGKAVCSFNLIAERRDAKAAPQASQGVRPFNDP